MDENRVSLSPPAGVSDKPSPTTDSVKKKSMFSISSILGEDKPQNSEDTNRPSSPSHDDKQPPETTQSDISGTTPPLLTSPYIGGNRLPAEAVKYNNFLAQMAANSEMAKLCRWPLLWSPWLGVQGAPGVQRPPLIQPTGHFLQTSVRPEGGAKGRPDTDDHKDSLEAGEIVRPVAFRRPPPEPHIFFKNGYPTPDPPVSLKELEGRSPSPYLDRRGGDSDMDFNDVRKNSNSTLESDGDLVEIEVDEAEDSDTESGLDPESRVDGVKSSGCERKKKTRTVFSRSQIFQLETMFDMKRYLSSSERSGLAKALNMTETQVKIWFQNRRNKWKRQVAAEIEAANMSQMTGQRLMTLPYIYNPDEISRGLRSSVPITPPIHSGHPVVPPSVHHYYNGMLRTHSS